MKNSKNILITGGSGYVGTRLTHQLIKNLKVNIVNYDISLFGDDHLPISENYLYVKEDLRNKEALKETLEKNKIDTVIHLACISNDPTFELKSDISKQINFDCFEDLVKISKNCSVGKFIYASTCSVYGITDHPNVTESHPLLPMTDYNKYKADCEPVLLNYLDDKFQGIIIRPATVCGYSEKMRFDVTVNILTNFAFNKGFIKVLGGQQTRPNIHLDDMCNIYEHLITRDIKDFNGKIYNAGIENLKIIEIANIIKKIFLKRMNKEIEIKIEPSTDKRSYNINSDKIQKELGFKFKKNVSDAVNDLLENFITGNLKNTFDKKWQNIEVLKANQEKLILYNQK
jgi:nucleoside-diphosphate-sugar epimerase